MTIALHAKDVPAPARPDYWRGVIDNAVVPMDLRFHQAPDFDSQIVTARLGPLGIVAVTDGPGEAIRTRSHIRRSTPYQFHIFVQGRGRVVAEQGRQTTELLTSDFTISDVARPYRCIHPARQAVCLTFPDGLVPERVMAELAGVRIRGHHGPAALFSNLVQQLPQHLASADEAARARLGATVLDLLVVALGASTQHTMEIPPQSRQRALLQQLHAFIETQLADPELSPQTVADAHHISVRYLHKLFEQQGITVAGWIRERRLDRCRRDLLDPIQRHTPVHAIGARSGFPDPAAFSRAFRKAYGLPPAAYRHTYGSTSRQ